MWFFPITKKKTPFISGYHKTHLFSSLKATSDLPTERKINCPRVGEKKERNLLFLGSRSFRRIVNSSGKWSPRTKNTKEIWQKIYARAHVSSAVNTTLSVVETRNFSLACVCYLIPTLVENDTPTFTEIIAENILVQTEYNK